MPTQSLGPRCSHKKFEVYDHHTFNALRLVLMEYQCVPSCQQKLGHEHWEQSSIEYDYYGYSYGIHPVRRKKHAKFSLTPNCRKKTCIFCGGLSKSCSGHHENC